MAEITKLNVTLPSGETVECDLNLAPGETLHEGDELEMAVNDDGTVTLYRKSGMCRPLSLDDELTKCDVCGEQCGTMAELVVHVAKNHKTR